MDTKEGKWRWVGVGWWWGTREGIKISDWMKKMQMFEFGEPSRKWLRKQRVETSSRQLGIGGSSLTL